MADGDDAKGTVEGEGGTDDRETVVIDKEAYESLLAAVAENTTATRRVISKVEEDEAAIADEERRQANKNRGSRYKDVKSPEEFADILKEELTIELMQTAIQPIANTVMSIVVASELKDAQKAHPDFDKHKDAVYDIVNKNPKLTIEEGYLIATGKAKKSDIIADKKEEEKGEKKEVKPVLGGEKSSVGGKFEPAAFKTTKDAAKAAFEKVYGKSSK
jgi:hypothetical protein